MTAPDFAEGQQLILEIIAQHGRALVPWALLPRIFGSALAAGGQAETRAAAPATGWGHVPDRTAVEALKAAFCRQHHLQWRYRYRERAVVFEPGEG